MRQRYGLMAKYMVGLDALGCFACLCFLPCTSLRLQHGSSTANTFEPHTLKGTTWRLSRRAPPPTNPRARSTPRPRCCSCWPMTASCDRRGGSGLRVCGERWRAAHRFAEDSTASMPHVKRRHPVPRRLACRSFSPPRRRWQTVPIPCPLALSGTLSGWRSSEIQPGHGSGAATRRPSL